MDNARVSDNWRTALNVGTTLTTRFWLSLAALLHGAGFLLQQTSWLSHPSYKALLTVVSYNYWGAAFIFVGFVGMWRVISPKSKPYCAWAVNSITCLLWMFQMGIRVWGIGYMSVLSVHMVLLIMAAWCLVRTEATLRDRETA